jgi:hypothetical protein
MLNEEEIRKQLENIPSEKCVAFAVRAAMRVLPILAIISDPKKQNSILSLFSKQEKQVFWFWKNKEDRVKYLFWS